MNLNVSKDFFDDVKENFLKLEPSVVDERISDVLMRWKDSPLLDKICPRWSCQSHSDKSRDSDYYFIFVTQDDGSDILYKIYEEIVEFFVSNYGIGHAASATYSITKLLNFKVGIKTPQPNIEIGINAHGIDTYIDRCILAWNHVLDKIEKGEI